MAMTQPTTRRGKDPRIYIAASANWTDLMEGMKRMITDNHPNDLPVDGQDQLEYLADLMRKKQKAGHK